MTADRSFFLSPVEPPPPLDGPPEGGHEPEDAGPPAPPEATVVDRRHPRFGAAAVVVALLLGAFGANRMAASDDASSGETAAEPGTTAGEQPRTPTTRRTPRTTTTSTTLPATLETLEVRGPLLPDPTGTTLVLATTHRLLVVHLDTGTIRAASVRPMEIYGGYPFQPVLPIGDGLLTTGEAPQLVSRLPGAGSVAADVPVYGGYLPSGVEGRYWTIDHRFDMELLERGPDGPTGRTVSLPGESGTVIPVGDTFIVSPFGSVLQVDASTGGATRIADGTAVAADGRTLARVRCDEALECGLVLSDLQGGDERFVGPPTPRSRYETYSGVRLSPDGRWLASPFYGEDQPGGIAVIDVAAGERRRYDALATSSRGGFPQSVAFTADSRWLLLSDSSADGQSVRAIRLEDGFATMIDLGAGRRGGQEGAALLAIPSIGADADVSG